MSRIDLSGLPAPDILQALDYEAELADCKEQLLKHDPELADALDLESEPLNKLLQVSAYRLLSKNNDINHSAKSMLLAYPTGTTLDHLAANANVKRLLIKKGNPDAVPPIPDVMESDTALRRRVQLEPEKACAGSKAAYIFWALSAGGDVRDVSLITPKPGYVELYVQSHKNDVATPELLDIVDRTLRTDTRTPYTDYFIVKAGQPHNWQVQAELILYPGPDKDVVKQTAISKLDEYIEQVRYLGYDVTISGLHHALHQSGVQKVNLLQPTDDIRLLSNQYSNCTGRFIGAVEYRDV